MKFSLAFLLIGFSASALSTPVENNAWPYKVADKDFLTNQLDILNLFKYVDFYPDFDNEYYLNLEDYKSWFTNAEVFDEFIRYYRQDKFLPKDAIFSVFYEPHLEQAKILFKMFYYAKDYKSFYEFALFARECMNPGLFVYSFSVAIIHRSDTYGIIIPPIYEIYPNYFFGSEVIQKAKYYKQIYLGDKENKNHHYYVYTNYSGHYLNLHPEQAMSYYMEDVGLNLQYYYFNLYYPFWLDGDEFHINKDNRGELYYYFYQQILARFYLERLSNGYGEIPYFNWEVPFETFYYPSLQYPNGLEFPSRPKFAKLYEYFYNYGESGHWNKYYYSYTLVSDYERRIHDAIDRGYVWDQEKKIDLYTQEGFNWLGNLIQSNPDSVDNKYYGSVHLFARHLLGYSYQPLNDLKLAPSVLEHFETSLRDPAFYQLYKKILLYFLRYKSHLNSYTEKELYFPGVEVEKVEFDPLITYFDTFDSDITHAVSVTLEEYEKNDFKVYARQERLNHKPFNYNIWVKSAKDVKAVVKVFIGPKYDEYGRYINISQNNYNFVQMEHFIYDLKSGENVIKRSSHLNKVYLPDRTSFYDLYKQVLDAKQGQKEFHIDGSQNYYYWSQRYMLPIGKENGMEYQIFVHVAPYVPYKGQQEPLGEYYYPRVGSAAQFVSGYALGYPLDRFIKFEKMWYDMPNSYFYDVKIYHKTVQEIQGVH